MKITYSYESELLGTAGGVKNVEAFFENEAFLILSGDALTDINLKELFAFHKEKGGICTLALTEVEDPSQYGVVMLDNNNRIMGFQEKPLMGEEKSKLANSGIYVFEPDIFRYIPPGSFYDFGRDLYPRLLEENIPCLLYTS